MIEQLRLSRRASQVAPSSTMAAAAAARALAEKGVSVVNLTAGEPDFATPEPIRKAAHDAIEAGYTKYPPLTGYGDLRQAVAEAAAARGFHVDPEGVVVSCGAKQAITNALLALVDQGDEVIVPAPYWVSYVDQVKLVGGTPVVVETRAADGFALDPALLAAAVTPRTVAIFVNSPCNPTGAVYDRGSLEAVAELAVRHDLWVLSDEIYAALTYEGEAVSFGSISPEAARRTVLIDGVSKSFAMTGWRIGWTACDTRLAKAIAVMQGQTTSGATAISQRAALAALRMDRAPVQAMVAEYHKRRDYGIERLNAIPGISCAKPVGAFYFFPHVSGLLGRSHQGTVIDSAATLTRLLLEREGLAIVGGDGFGAPEYVRISYAASMASLAEGFDRLERFVRALS
ncbi:MAG TPA: pyridoxal phosphate-dependent aminotransferase [Candidatus Dormibacteraeota bacterium]|nr:pyridoxal phosphate-dependent aminotransferase [Candidatus Dormibacteraeota bacterium]